MSKRRRSLSLALVIFSLSIGSCVQPESRTEQELARLLELEQTDETYSDLFERVGDPQKLYREFQEGVKQADDDWQRQQSVLAKIKDLGTTKALRILPLVDWQVADASLVGESAVSYLVKTDSCTILFDVGGTGDGQDTTPLLHNMEKLGVQIEEIDCVVISHPHGDHTGGSKWVQEGTFSLGAQQIDLGDIRAYTPVPMTYPGIEVEYLEEPTVIAPGVATTGVITNYYFFMGSTPEQSIVVNVEGKGLVVISGCGHQTLRKLLERVETVFDVPLYGLLGGLHYPVTKGRNIDIHRYLGTGKLPGEFLTIDEVEQNIELLRARQVGLAGLSPHDSSDDSLQAFRDAFGADYVEIVVGEEILIPGRVGPASTDASLVSHLGQGRERR